MTEEVDISVSSTVQRSIDGLAVDVVDSLTYEQIISFIKKIDEVAADWDLTRLLVRMGHDYEQDLKHALGDDYEGKLDELLQSDESLTLRDGPVHSSSISNNVSVPSSVKRCPGCNEEYTIKGFVDKTESGCQEGYVANEGVTQAWCASLRKQV